MIRRFLPYTKPHGRYVAVGLFCALISIPVGLAEPLIMRAVFDQALPRGDYRLLVQLGLILIILTLINHVVGFISRYVSTVFHNKVLFTVRRALYEHVQRLSLRYYADKKTGYLMARQSDDVDNLRGIMADTFTTAAVNLLKAVVFVAMLFYLEWRLATGGLVFVAAIFGTMYLYSRPLRMRNRETQEAWARVSGTLHEGITGIYLVKSAAAEKREARQFVGQLVAYVRAVLRRDMMGMFSRYTTGLIGGLAPTGVLLLGAYLIMKGHFTVGGLFAFFMYLGQLFGATSGLADLNPTLQRALASLERIYEVMDTPPDIREKPDAIPLIHPQGRVTFEDVAFEYLSGQPVLQGISLDVPPGTLVALVGPSGAGKTTMVNLIPRFYDPTQGTIYIDGYDVRDVRLASLRTHIGVVPQDVFLFARTIRENILYGKPKATEEEVVEAARLAHAHDFIVDFPEGYDTVIGERGVKLSGGQRQRIAIAREILRNPRILILDEATSSLDSESERLIQQALDNLMRDRTSFVIAHRLSTVLHADLIVVLDRGYMVEQGTHEELLAYGGLYRRLYETQFKRRSEIGEAAE